MKLNIYLENLTPNKNKGLWYGRKFWLGVFSLLDYEIEEVHTYESGQAVDFNHEMMCTSTACDRIDDGESDTFWIQDGKIGLGWHNQITNEKEAKQKIMEQIKII